MHIQGCYTLERTYIYLITLFELITRMKEQVATTLTMHEFVAIEDTWLLFIIIT